jgi:lipopolysaccharide export system protein LptA
MRRTRWVLLASILILVAAVAGIYRAQKDAQDKAAPAKPAALPDNVSVSAQDWRWSKNDGDRPIVEVRARNFEQKSDPPRVDLEKVELKLFHKDGKAFDLVKSEQAELRMEDSTLYSAGDVEITMGLTEQPNPTNRLVRIQTSGVTFETQSGRATTDQDASFAFENSEGTAHGAEYDPGTRDLHLRSAVKLNWRGKGPASKPMTVEAGELNYRENEDKVYLKPWSRLQRGTMTLNAADSVVTLDNGEIRLVEATQAKGEDRAPGRQLLYGAAQLWLHFGAKGVMESIEGKQGARLETIADSGRTVVNSQNVDLAFAEEGGDSILKQAKATGNTVVESYPVRRGTGEPPSDRVLKSDIVEMIMRPGGQEIDHLDTHSPGQIEFLPKSPRQRYRRLDGDRFTMVYGANNQLEKFRASQVKTLTRAIKKGDPDRKTSSQDLQALFDPKTGELQTLEQWTAFQYEEGPRRARSDHARLESATDRIVLKGAARIWDPTGSTDALQIELDQKTGDMIAEGKVTSTRLPDEKKPKKPQGSLLDSSDTVQARADRMQTREENTWIRYDGNALLWQGPNRIEANSILIQRKLQRLDATGNVVSQFREKTKNLFTVVRAPQMTYWDVEKKAHYMGNARLNRGSLVVTSRDLFAWFSQKENDSSLERAEAVGDSVIVDSGADASGKMRTRRGTSERSDYDVAAGRVILSGGAPRMDDSLKGTTKGERLTWFANDDRLLVDGSSNQPAASRILKKR